jgi:glutamate dehydrogenase/leucine dehydrogenase
VSSRTVSYFEWLQNRRGEQWSRPEMERHLEEIMAAAFEKTWRTASDRKLPHRVAAACVAVERIARAWSDQLRL